MHERMAGKIIHIIKCAQIQILRHENVFYPLESERQNQHSLVNVFYFCDAALVIILLCTPFCITALYLGCCWSILAHYISSFHFSATPQKHLCLDIVFSIPLMSHFLWITNTLVKFPVHMFLTTFPKCGSKIPRLIIEHECWLITVVHTSSSFNWPSPIGIVVTVRQRWCRPCTGVVIPWIKRFAAFFSCVEHEELVIAQHVVRLLP